MSVRHATACMAMLLSQAAFGFGSEGHQAVGRMADGLLQDTKAGERVRQILAPGEGLQLAAIWADCARDVKPKEDFAYVPNPKYYDRSCKFFDEKPEGVAEMQEYVRRNNDNCLYSGRPEECHKAFHFTNVPLQLGKYDANSVGAGTSDVVHAITAAISTLRDETVTTPPFRFASGNEGKREALRLLAHLVGDIHQPLHVGSVYLSPGGMPTNPNRTARFKGTYDNYGGNLLMLGTSSNLHSYWDGILPALAQENLTAEAATVPATEGPVETWSEQWATESIQLARNAFTGLAYGSSPPNKGGWPLTIKRPVTYEKTKREVQRAQVIKAGARLAEILQFIWPE